MKDNYFENVYLRRLNRYGCDYQSRIQAQRERDFESRLLKSVYRVDFEYMNDTHPATLERYKQDETELMAYLLTRVSLNLPNGTILMIPDKNLEPQPWLVYWLETIQASGYNKYIVLKMTHYITWRDCDKNMRGSWCYMYGQEDNMLKDELRSRSRMDTLYTENLKTSFFIMPTNEFLRRDDYLEIGEGNLKEAYRVTGYDIQSTPGVEYVTVDPVYLRDNSQTPEYQIGDKPEDYYWLNGGGSNGGA